MKYLEILSYVCVHHKDYRKTVRQYLDQDIFFDLGFTFEKREKLGLTFISKGYASKIINGKVQHQLVSQRLSDVTVRQKIEQTLNLPSLFSCTTGQEIDALVNDASDLLDDSRSIGAGEVDTPVRSGIDDFHLIPISDVKNEDPLISEGEIGCQRALAQFLLRGGHGLVHWGAAPWAGASFVAHSLAMREDIKKVYDLVCLIRPTDLDDPYAKQLERLISHFDIKANKSEFPRAVVSLLRERRVLLILLDACYVPDQESFAKYRLVRRVIDQARTTRHEDAVSHLLTIGRSQAIQEMLGDSVTARLNGILRVQPKLRFPLYSKLFKHYTFSRGRTRPEEGGSRLKRGRWHYEAIRDAESKEVWPAMIRLRAFFASNSRNYSYFDPMRGFDELSGYSGDLPASIAMARQDVLAYLHRSTMRSQHSEVKALRLCSTAKHWLTRDALDVLRQPYRPKDETAHRVSELTTDAFERLANLQHCPIGFFRPPQEDSINLEQPDEVFILSLGIKAIVQSEWLRSDPFDRAVAHWRVAERLWKLQDDKDLLAKEFPYLPHWGRSRIFILGECIRHLMASIRGVSTEKHEVTEIFDRDFFPSPPSGRLLGCDPNEVVNFCYARVFQREINANRAFSPGRTALQTGRALAKRHGAFEYAAELLQLLGERGPFGTQNEYLMPTYAISYMRECAFACLDIGELNQANEIFLALSKISVDGEFAASEDMLNLSLVATELNEIERAVALVASVRETRSRLKTIEPTAATGDDAFSRRIATREAHIAAVTGNPQEVIRLSKDVFSREPDPQRWDAELQQNYIRSLANVEESRSEGLKNCLAATFRASGAGFQHEALGYRVLLGRIYRQRGEIGIAEQILDDAQRDILSYGCSERAYLEMLYEAGRTLCSMDIDFKIVRAYSSYLRPCLVRSRSRGYGRFEGLAMRYSDLALDRISERIRLIGGEKWQAVIESALEDEINHISKEKIGKEGFFEVDPLFGYYASGSQQVIKRLRTEKGIDAERVFLVGDLS